MSVAPTPHPDDPPARTARPGLLAEARRRGVLRVATSYAVIAWLLLQIGDVTFEPLGVPEWVLRVLIGAAAIGFPLALWLAWFFELTPRGLERDTAGAGAVRPGVGGLRRYADVVIIGALVAVVAFLLLRDRTTQSPVAAAHAASIAVLPFRNLSGDPTQEYFSDGVAEEILGRLVQVKELRVAARSSSFALKGKDLDAQAIAERLGVATLLEGSVRRAGQELRLSASLVDGRTGVALWSRSFVRPATDIFAVQEEVAQAVIEEILASGPARAAAAAPMRPPTLDLGAHDYYLLALSLRWRRDAESLGRAVRFLEQAVELDPKYAEAQAQLARLIMLHSTWAGSREAGAREQVLARAERAVYAALAADPTLAAAHSVLGTVLAATGRPGAAEAFARALELNPNDATILHEYSGYRAATPSGNGELIRLGARILELDPLAVVPRMNHAFSLIDAGQPEQAMEVLRRGLELHRDDALALEYFAVHCVFVGLFDETYRIGRMQLALGEEALGWGNVIWAVSMADAKRAAGLLAETERRGVTRPLLRKVAISVYTHLRDWPRAMAALEAARLEAATAARELDERALHHHGAFALLLQERLPEARAELARAEPFELDPWGGTLECCMAGQGLPAAIEILRRSGEAERARALIEEWLPKVRRAGEKGEISRHFVWTTIAAVESLEGRDEAAVAALRRALDLPPRVVNFFPELPWYARLRGTPGYAGILQRLEARRAELRAAYARIDAELGVGG